MIKVDCSYKDIAGIYCIKNILNNKVYIGSTTTLYRRIVSHKSLLNNNRHHNKYLQYSFNKYGEENFIVNILIICEQNDILIYEQKIIDLYKSSNRKFGYNSRKICSSNIGFKHSKRTKKKISKAKVGHKRTQKQREIYLEMHLRTKGKPVLQFTLSGEFLEEYRGIRLAGRLSGICCASIGLCCSGKYKKAGGFIWKYKNG